MPPVEGSDELLRRLDVDELAALCRPPVAAEGHLGHRATTYRARGSGTPTSSPPWPAPSTYGHYATGRKPRDGEDAVLMLDEFSALASGVDSAINLIERLRDVGVQVVVAAQSVEGLGDHRQAPRLLASCAGGIVLQQCPDPERLIALAGQERVLEHNWELDFYGPPGLRQGPHGGAAPHRPRAGASGPAGRGLGDPGRPKPPPARPATPDSAVHAH
jgi:hypothetical protein